MTTVATTALAQKPRLVLLGTVLAAGALLAGCGSGPSQVGAAAIVGDHQISIEHVQQRVSTILAKEPQAESMLQQHKLDQVSRLVIGDEVSHELLTRAAAADGVSVSEDEVTKAVNESGGVDAGSRGSIQDPTTFRSGVRDKLLAIALGRKHYGDQRVTVDLAGLDKNQAVEQAKQISADPSKAAEVFAKDRASGAQVVTNDTMTPATANGLAGAPFFGVPAGTVLAFPPDQNSGQWVLAYVHERKTESSGDAAAGGNADPQLLALVGQRVAQTLTWDTDLRINPRYGVWDPVAFGLAHSEGERGGVVYAPRTAASS